jgi:hypothetical protein
MPWLVAVDRWERRAAKSASPCSVRQVSEIFNWSLVGRRSLSLLVVGEPDRGVGGESEDVGGVAGETPDQFGGLGVGPGVGGVAAGGDRPGVGAADEGYDESADRALRDRAEAAQ